MIYLNLLPPEEKVNISRGLALRRGIAFGSFFLFLIFIFLVLLASIWFYLFIQAQSIENIIKKNEPSQENKTLLEFKKEVGELNLGLQNAVQIEGQIKRYSSMIEELASLASGGIKFKELSFDENKVSLAGLALTRAELLAFKEALEKSSNFENVESPLSNLLKQNNIDFSFVFKIKEKKQ
ncbi:MAG: PilN domain-containing protein [Candidatus Portnoybacteria bacterium]|nr:PilN domain-containing protein [Candidatus Portnoybacteria bacterium]